jgi:hypothetical protein
MARRSQRYDDALIATREVVNSHDPIALLEIGAPDDEYDPEIADLVRLVLAEEPIQEAAVNDVWVRWFGEDYSMVGSEQLSCLTADLVELQNCFAAT